MVMSYIFTVYITNSRHVFKPYVDLSLKLHIKLTHLKMLLCLLLIALGSHVDFEVTC